MPTPTSKPRRFVTRDLAADVSKAPARQKELDLLASGGIWPLNAPGMPPPGPNFLTHADNLGDDTQFEGKGKEQRLVVVGQRLQDLYRQALRNPGFALPVDVKAGVRKMATFVPGHIWGQYAQEAADGNPVDVDGPHPAEVMVIGKMPGEAEEITRRCLVGDSGELLISLIRELHIEGSARWYVTNLLKFRPPDGGKTLKAGWLKDCMPLLHQELRLVRPKYILCLGADASKALLGDHASVTNMDGRVEEFTYCVDLEHPADYKDASFHTSLVMTVVHPAQVLRAGDPATNRQLRRGLSRFRLLTQGIRFDLAEEGIDHRAIRDLDTLRCLLEEIRNDPEKTDNVYAMDAEWQGEHPQNAGSYVRTVQFAWKPKHACSIILHDTAGKPCFVDATGKVAIKEAMALLMAFFKDARIVGHFFVADLEWLVKIGLDLRKQFRVPLYPVKFDALPPRLKAKYRADGWMEGDTIPAYFRTRHEGGADTGLRAHAIEETAQLGLEVLLTRYTTCPRYDLPLEEWKHTYCKEHNLKAKDLDGYGACPDEIIVPYGCYDADGTLRLFYEQEQLIDCDYENNCCWEAAWESMLATRPILEIHQTGLPVDKGLIDAQTRVFMAAREAQEKKIRDWACWPEFNIRSVMQVKEFLFGTEYNGKRDEWGNAIELRPPGGKSLGLLPVQDTSKPPKMWSMIRQKGLEREHSPGTGKTILGVLIQDNPAQATQVQWIRDYRFLDQVLKGVLRPPKNADGEEQAPEADDSAGGAGSNLEGLVYDAGLASVICDDGRVRTHLYPTAETARWKSARPNLQNISKRRDADYARILGKENYKRKLRAIFKAPPGCVLVEADLKSAELFGMGIMSGDEHLLDHCFRNQLAEDDPNYYDIHSNVAVMAFGIKVPDGAVEGEVAKKWGVPGGTLIADLLKAKVGDPLPATKSALELVGKIALRVGAKNVIFGTAYGRMAKAIALQAKEEGNPISVEQAQQIIDTIFRLYPKLVAFFEECRRRVSNPRWMCNCFGRFRRFPFTDDEKMIGEFERQGMNFPIQSMVASIVDRGLAYMMDYRDRVLKDPNFFRIALQIHDAGLFIVPYKNVERFVEEVIPMNMTHRVPVYPTHLDGIPTGEGPYYLGTDVEVFHHWGEKLTVEQATEWGVPLKYAAKPKKAA